MISSLPGRHRVQMIKLLELSTSEVKDRMLAIGRQRLGENAHQTLLSFDKRR